MKNLVEELWVGYRDRVIPKDAPGVQFAECRKAFYAGALALFTRLLREVTPGEEPQAADLELMEGLEQEFLEYGATVVADGTVN